MLGAARLADVARVPVVRKDNEELKWPCCINRA